MNRITLLSLLFLLIVTNVFYAQESVELEMVRKFFTEPVDIANAGDERLFIVEKQGIIKILTKDGEALGTNFLDISNKIADSRNERGLLGLAFHPNYAENGFFYVNYTDDASDTQISRFSVSSTDPNVADPDSEFKIINIAQPRGNHNGGDLNFGPDGYLYIGTGDGGGAGDPDNLAQTNSSLLGKMLRIDVDNTDGEPYGIPEDNPFLDDPDIRDEIWSTGLRNPWRYSFDRNTGDLWIGDVGQNKFEEIHLRSGNSTGGENYGWRCYEGNESFDLSGCGDISNYVFPVFAYANSRGGAGCSVTGGYVYRGKQFPALLGKYIYADFCSGNIWTLEEQADGEWENNTVFQGSASSGWSTFGEDENGELYVASLGGAIWKITTNETVNVSREEQIKKVTLLKNPFRDQLELTIELERATFGRLSVQTPEGKEVHNQQVELYGVENVTISTKRWASGIYYLILESGDQKVVKRVLKQ